MARRGRVHRKTSETDVLLELTLDGQGRAEVETGLPFFNHMLSQLARHAPFDLMIRATGDLEVDPHHTMEDVGLALGEALAQALGEKRGIRRYGHAAVPMDDALAWVAVDLSGRPYFVYQAERLAGRIGEFDALLLKEFFRAMATAAKANLHVGLSYGENPHHMAEAIFKAAARALGEATALDPRVPDVPSTKGRL